MKKSLLDINKYASCMHCTFIIFMKKLVIFYNCNSLLLTNRYGYSNNTQ